MKVNLFPGKSKLSKILSEHLLINPQRMILLSFLLVIICGTILLSLPIATTAKGSLPLLDALFTATSATCVTGLIVTDTVSTFSPFGQWTILILIQLGGLGIMSFSTFFMFLFVGKLSIYGRDILIDRFSQKPILGLGKLIKTVFLFTITLELTGAALLTVSFLQDYSLADALYFGLFHSVSSFCNAGFSLLGNSYMDYAGDWYFCIINVLLIIAGGLGFIVIFDIKAQLSYFRSGILSRLSLHSRIALSTTFLLIAIGTLGIFLLETQHSLADHPWHEQFLISIFQSVTTRTAGFNTISITSLSLPTLFIMLIMMVIGASPGSCGGGIKTTTFTLFIQNLLKQFSNNKDINVFSRRIPSETLSRAISIVFFAIFTISAFIFLLLLSEDYFGLHQGVPPELMDIIFEVVSAFGTVGLSTGITETLSPVGKLLITIMMYIGRLGPLTLVFALKTRKASSLRYMKEDILVG